MPAAVPWRRVPGGVRITLRVAPGAARNRAALVALPGTGGRAGDQDRLIIKVHITAPPNDGQANAAVIKFLAKAWRLPRRDISLVHGATARTKVLEITADPDLVSARLQAWLGTLSDSS